MRPSAAMAILTAMLALALTLGCASAPQKVATVRVDGAAIARSVVLCKTSLASLTEALGQPSRDGILHSARVVSWITDWDSPIKYLAVLVDDQGVVTDLYWNIPTEIPWVPSDQCRGR
jgi:hypothetical protein